MNVVNEIRNDWKSDKHVNGRVAGSDERLDSFQNGRIVGNVNNIKREVTWFVLSDGRVVTVHKAFHEHPANVDEPKYTMFVSDNETFASVTAQQLGIDYVLLVNADDELAEEFLAESGETIKERLKV